MKSYPTISKDIQNIPCYAFDKLDGSNIRAEWNRKNGFCKFGSRHQLIDNTHLFLGEAPDLVKSKYEKSLSDIFKKERFERVVCFFEFYGENSFAGNHQKEKHDVVLFDLDVFKRGILNPSEFIKLTTNLDIPKIIYQGNINSDFVDKIKNSQMTGVTFEGVVCKSNLTDKHKQSIMFKVKSLSWLNKLKNYCGDNENMFKELS